MHAMTSDRSAKAYCAALLALMVLAGSAFFVIKDFRGDLYDHVFNGWSVAIYLLVWACISVGLWLIMPPSRAPSTANPTARPSPVRTIWGCLLLLAVGYFIAVCWTGRATEGLAIPPTDANRMVAWDTHGQSAPTQPGQDLQSRVGGDEFRNLAAANAVAEVGISPWALHDHFEASRGSSAHQFLHWHYSHHPVGMALLYAPFVDNPVWARGVTWIMLVLAAVSVGCLFRQLTQLQQGFYVGTLLVLFYWHMVFVCGTVVNNDVPLLICATWALLWLFNWRRDADANLGKPSPPWPHDLRDPRLWGIGLVLGIGVGFKWSFPIIIIAYAVLAIWGRDWKRHLTAAVPLAVPGVVIGLITLWHTSVTYGSSDLTILIKLAQITGLPLADPEAHTPEPRYGAAKLPAVMATHIGLPGLVLLAGSAVFAWGLSGSAERRGLVRYIAPAMIILLPWLLLFPNPRYLLPAIPLLLCAVGIPVWVRRCPTPVLAGTIAAYCAFTVVKFARVYPPF